MGAILGHSHLSLHHIGAEPEDGLVALGTNDGEGLVVDTSLVENAGKFALCLFAKSYCCPLNTEIAWLGWRGVKIILILEKSRATVFLAKHRFEGGKGQLFDPKSGTFPPLKLCFPFCKNIRVKKIHNPHGLCKVSCTAKPFPCQDR